MAKWRPSPAAVGESVATSLSGWPGWACGSLSTTLVLTSDHGRGSTVDDWHSHSEKVQGADQIWTAIVGPDTPAVGEGENVPEVFQRDIAPTVLELMGFDYREYAGVEGKPIALAGRGK